MLDGLFGGGCAPRVTMLDGLFGGGCAPKCKSLIKRIKSRIDILRKKRTSKANLLRQDVAQLIMKGRDQSAFSRVELLLIELSLLHGYNMIESFCDSILKQLSYIQKQKECPQDVREAVSSLIFAAARCADLPELQGLRDIFATKYGNEFAVAAVELFPDCGVNQQMREKLLATAISSDAKLKLMKEIAEEASFPWDPSNLQDSSQRLQGFRSSHNETPLYHHRLSDKSPMDGTSIHSLNNNGNAYSKSSNIAEKHEGAVLNGRVEMASRSVGCEEHIYDTAGHEDSLNKPCIRQSIDDRAFDASSERQEDNRNLRYSPTRPRTNKTSRHISSAKGNDLKEEYSNGSADNCFPKEGDGVYERGSRLRPTEQIKSDTAHRSRTSRRASHLLVDRGEPQELSGEPEIRKLEDHPGISRRASTGISNDLNRLDANGVRTGIHGMHGKASHLMVDRDEPQEFCERPENKKLQDNSSFPKRESIGTSNASNRFETNGVWAGSHRMHSKTSHLMVDREEPQEFSERPENKKLQDNCSIPRRESVNANKTSSRFETNGVWAGSHRTNGAGSVHGDQDDDLRRFDRPVWDVNAGQEDDSEFYDVPQTRSKAKSKSSKILDHCAVENKSLDLSQNDINAGRFIVANRANQPTIEPSVEESLARRQYSEHYLESQERFTSNRSSLHSPDKSEPTWQHREDKASYKAYNGCHRSYNKFQYCDDEDSDDSNFVRNENLNAVSDGLSQVHERVSSRASSRRVNYVDKEASFDDGRYTSRRASLEPQHREVGTVQERVSGRESSRRVNYVDEEATFDDARPSSRRESNKNNNFGKLRSHKGVNNFQQSEHERKYETYYSDEQRVKRFYENNDSYLISVDRLPSEPQCREEGMVQETVSSRKGSRRVNYIDEEATFDDAKHGPRRTSDKGNNFGKFRSYEGVDSFEQLEHVGKYESYLSDEQRLHENNPISVNSLPSEQHKEEDTKLGKHGFRANHKLPGSNEPPTRKNLNQIDDQYSDLEAQSSQQSDYTKEYTKPKYLENAEAWKKPKGSRRTHERKTQKEGDNLVHSLNTYRMENQNSNTEGHYLRENQESESYVKETPLAVEKPERKHSHRRHRHEGRLPNGNIKLPQCNEGYSANKEQSSDGLDGEYEGKVSSEKHYRYEKQHCESKQKGHHTSGDSNVGIVREANSLRHYSEQEDDHQSFGGRHAIPQLECSPAKGKRHDIQDANSCTTRNTLSASHRAQSHNHNQSVYSESAIAEKHSRSMMPSNQEVRDSYDSPHDFSVNGCNAPPSPKPSVPARASVLPESLSQAKPQYGKTSGSPPRRPPRGQQRAVSLPAEHSHSTPLHPNFSKSASDVGPCQMVHVHPKLPDYDDLAARFAALRQQGKTK